MNVRIAIRLARIVVHVLSDVFPSVPLRGAPLVSAFRSRKLNPELEFKLLNKLRVRRARPVDS